MKKLLVFLLMLLFTTPAFADEWKTYRFPSEPDYILSVPSTYHVLYSGMPEDSAVLQTMGITAKQAELQLEFNNAFTLVYSDDFSSFFTISKFEDNTVYDYDELSSDDLNEIAAIVAEQMRAGYEANSSIVLKDAEYLVFETDHARYITIISQLSLGSSEQALVQCMTTSKGYQVLLTFNCSNNVGALNKDMDTFETIVSNFVPL